MANKVAISTLPFEFNNLCDKFNELKDCGVDYVHCDIMDGHYVNNKTFTTKDLADICECFSLPLDVHFMALEPLKDIELLKNVAYITIHYEIFKNNEELISATDYIKSLGFKAGICVDLNTDVAKIENLLSHIDLVLIMSVKAGAGGQAFNNSAVAKIKFCDEYRKKNTLNFKIEVDGGINDKNVEDCVLAGADIVVSGSFVANAIDKIKAVEMLKK